MNLRIPRKIINGDPIVLHLSLKTSEPLATFDDLNVVEFVSLKTFYDTSGVVIRVLIYLWSPFSFFLSLLSLSHLIIFLDVVI